MTKLEAIIKMCKDPSKTNRDIEYYISDILFEYACHIVMDEAINDSVEAMDFIEGDCASIQAPPRRPNNSDENYIPYQEHATWISKMDGWVCAECRHFTKFRSLTCIGCGSIMDSTDDPEEEETNDE